MTNPRVSGETYTVCDGACRLGRPVIVNRLSSFSFIPETS